MSLPFLVRKAVANNPLSSIPDIDGELKLAYHPDVLE